MSEKIKPDKITPDVQPTKATKITPDVPVAATTPSTNFPTRATQVYLQGTLVPIAAAVLHGGYDDRHQLAEKRFAGAYAAQVAADPAGFKYYEPDDFKRPAGPAPDYVGYDLTGKDVAEGDAKMAERRHDPVAMMTAYLYAKGNPNVPQTVKDHQLAIIRSTAGYQAALDQAATEATADPLPPPKTAEEYAGDAVGGVAVFAVKAALLSSVGLGGKGPAGAVGWGAAGGLDPRNFLNGVMMGSVLQGLAAAPVKSIQGAIIRTAEEMGFFGGTALAQGLDWKDVVVQALLPAVMSGPAHIRAGWKAKLEAARDPVSQQKVLNELLAEGAKQKAEKQKTSGMLDQLLAANEKAQADAEPAKTAAAGAEKQKPSGTLNQLLNELLTELDQLQAANEKAQADAEAAKPAAPAVESVPAEALSLAKPAEPAAGLERTVSAPASPAVEPAPAAPAVVPKAKRQPARKMSPETRKILDGLKAKAPAAKATSTVPTREQFNSQVWYRGINSGSKKATWFTTDFEAAKRYATEQSFAQGTNPQVEVWTQDQWAADTLAHPTTQEVMTPEAFRELHKAANSVPPAENKPRAVLPATISDPYNAIYEKALVEPKMPQEAPSAPPGPAKPLAGAEAPEANVGAASGAVATPSPAKVTRPAGVHTTNAADGTEAEIRLEHPAWTVAKVRAEVAKRREAQETAKAVEVAEHGEDVAPGVPIEERAQHTEPDPADAAAAAEIATRPHAANVAEFVAEGDMEGLVRYARDAAGAEGITPEEWVKKNVPTPVRPMGDTKGTKPHESVGELMAATSPLPAEAKTGIHVAADKFAKAHGLEIHWRTGDVRANGYHIAPGHIVLDAAHPVEGLAHTILHEFGHDWEVRDPTGHKAFFTELRRLAPELLDAALTRYYHEAGATPEATAAARARGEPEAEFLAWAFQDHDFLRGLRDAKPGLWRRLQLAVGDYLKSVLRFFGAKLPKRAGEQLTPTISRDFIPLTTRSDLMNQLGHIAGPLLDAHLKDVLAHAGPAWDGIEKLAAAGKPRPALKPLPKDASDELDRRNKARDDHKIAYAKWQAAAKGSPERQAAAGAAGAAKQAEAASNAKLDALGFGTEARQQRHIAEWAESKGGKPTGGTAGKPAGAAASGWQSTPPKGLAHNELLALATKKAIEMAPHDPEVVDAILAMHVSRDGAGRFDHPDQVLADLRAMEDIHSDDRKMESAPEALRLARSSLLMPLARRATDLPSKFLQAGSRMENYGADVGAQIRQPVHRVTTRADHGTLLTAAKARSHLKSLETILGQHGVSWKKFERSKKMSDNVVSAMEGHREGKSPVVLALADHMTEVDKVMQNDESVARIITAVEGEQKEGVVPPNMSEAEYKRCQLIMASGGDVLAKLHAEADGKGWGIIAKNYAPRSRWGRSASLTTHDMSFSSVQATPGQHSRLASGPIDTSQSWERNTIPMRIKSIYRGINNATVVRPALSALDVMLHVAENRMEAALKDAKPEKADAARAKFKAIHDAFEVWANEIRGKRGPQSPWSRLNNWLMPKFFTIKFATGMSGLRNEIEVARNADVAYLARPGFLKGWSGGKGYFGTYVDQAPLLNSDIAQLGVKPLPFWWRPIELLAQSFGFFDRTGRIHAFTVRGQRVLHAFEGFDPAKSTAKALVERMRAAGLDEMIPDQQARFIEELHQHGLNAAANYAANVHVSVVHGRYERWNRSPAEMGELGRIYGSVMEYPRGKVQQLLTDGGKLLRGNWAEKRTAAGRLIGQYVTIGLTQMLVDRIRGLSEKDREDQDAPGWLDLSAPYGLKDFLNPAKTLGGLVWKAGGVSLDLLKNMGDWSQALVKVLSGDHAGRAAFEKTSTTLARDFVPYWQQAAQATKVLMGESKGLDQKGIEYVYGVIDKTYSPPKTEKMDRDAVEIAQTLVFGSHPGRLRWDVAAQGEKAQRMISLAAKIPWVAGYKGDAGQRTRDQAELDRLAGDFHRRGLKTNADAMQGYLDAADELRSAKEPPEENPYRDDAPDTLQELLRRKR